MGNKIYPIGIQNFESLRLDGYFYIDKTALIYQLIDPPCSFKRSGQNFRLPDSGKPGSSGTWRQKYAAGTGFPVHNEIWFHCGYGAA